MFDWGVASVVQVVAVDPSNPSTVYSGTEGGLLVSKDGGDTWTSINGGVGLVRGVTALAINPVDSNLLYAGTSNDLFRSRDGGTTWTSAIDEDWVGRVSGYRPFSTSLAVSPIQPPEVFAGVKHQGLFRSSDQGQTWVAANVGLSNYNVQAIAVNPREPDTLYVAALEVGIFRSRDRGTTWTRINQGITDPHVLALAIDPQEPCTLYAGTIFDGLFKSTDGGDNWNQIDVLCPGTLFSRHCPTVTDIALDPVDPATIYFVSGGPQIKRSTDGGQTWSRPQVIFGEGNLKTIAIDPETPSTLYVGDMAIEGNGVLKSTDRGENWTPVNNGLADLHIYALAIDPVSPSTLFAGSKEGIFRSVDGGQLWSSVQTGLANQAFPVSDEGLPVLSLAIDPSLPSTVYAGTNNGAFLSAVGGDAWKPINEGLYDPRVQVLAVDPLGSSVYAGTTGSGIFKLEPTSVYYFAHFGDGAIGSNQISSQIVLMNLSPTEAARTTIFARGSDGSPLRVDLNGEDVPGERDLTIPSGGLRILETDGKGRLVTGTLSVRSDHRLEGVIQFGGNIGAAGVGRSRPLRRFVAPVQVSAAGGIDTGIGVMNLEESETALDLELYEASGELLATVTVVLPALGHRARFLRELDWTPWDQVPTDLEEFVGVLRANASGNVAAIVLQTRPGELVTFPVAQPPPNPIESGGEPGLNHKLYFAHLGNGVGGQNQISSQLLLINLEANQTASARVEIRGDDGNPLPVTLGGEEINGYKDVDIPARGLTTLETTGAGPLVAGSVTVSSDQPLAGVVIFAGSAGAAGVAASDLLTGGFMAPVQTNTGRHLNTGIAIMSLEEVDSSLELQLCDQEGNALAAATVTLPPKGHLAAFADEFQWERLEGVALDFSDFQGILRSRSPGKISATVIQARPGQFLTMPVAAGITIALSAGKQTVD